MTVIDEFSEMILKIKNSYEIPPIKDIFLPRYYPNGQPKHAEFMAMRLEGGTVGLSFILNDEIDEDQYNEIPTESLSGKDAMELINKAQGGKGIDKMLGLAAINAICQEIMKKADISLDFTTDSLGLINVESND
ncbi:MAG: hypothetical protein GF364_14810, partial [Candidatus Lokiarchaeota archaeon]|nr:hypothetical protein [Candidatus Lokiarchaeota archaeon]